MAQILLVDDDNLLRWALQRRLESRGHSIHEAGNLAEAEAWLREHRPDLVLLDVNLPDGSGLDFLQERRELLGESLVLVMTSEGDVEIAVRAMKLGAWDFLSKPIDHDELLSLVEQALERQRDRLDAERSRREREQGAGVDVIARSDSMKRLLDMARTVAASGATTVLVSGETGTGKEVLARFIHAASPRASAPLVPLDAAALPESLIESELFGHEKGAFTDARAARKGIFELAQGGTVILDEIGELPIAMQTKLLRLLEERSFRRVGGGRQIFVDVRVIALTNRNLRTEVSRGTFRQDLFFRLEVFPIFIPPLRERREDILPLALHFLAQFANRAGKVFQDFSPAARQALLDYAWPGNVRELRNLMERISILEPGPIVEGSILDFGPTAHGPDTHLAALPIPTHRDTEPAGLPAPDTAASSSSPSPDDAVVPLDLVEFDMVCRAMRVTVSNQTQAAKLLGITRDQLRYRLARYRTEGRWRDLDDGETDALAAGAHD